MVHSVFESEPRIEGTLGRFYAVIDEAARAVAGHPGLTIVTTKRVGPFATQELAQRYLASDAPVRVHRLVGDIYDEDGRYLGSSLRQAAKKVGIAHSALSMRLILMPDGRRMLRRKENQHTVRRVVTEDGRVLGSSFRQAAKTLQVQPYMLYRYIVATHDDGTIVMRITKPPVSRKRKRKFIL
jgi:hypothetical protein